MQCVRARTSSTDYVMLKQSLLELTEKAAAFFVRPKGLSAISSSLKQRLKRGIAEKKQ